MDARAFQWDVEARTTKDTRSARLETLPEALSVVEKLGSRNEHNQWEPSANLLHCRLYAVHDYGDNTDERVLLADYATDYRGFI